MFVYVEALLVVHISLNLHQYLLAQFVVSSIMFAGIWTYVGIFAKNRSPFTEIYAMSFFIHFDGLYSICLYY